MNKVIVHAGDIFCIPLFMPKDDWKLKVKLSDKDLDKDFAFGRVIEANYLCSVKKYHNGYK